MAGKLVSFHVASDVASASAPGESFSVPRAEMLKFEVNAQNHPANESRIKNMTDEWKTSNLSATITKIETGVRRLL